MYFYQMFGILWLFIMMDLLCTNIGHDISNNCLIHCSIHDYIYLAGFQGQPCLHLCFLDCFALYFLIHIGKHLCINIVATAHLFWNN